MGQQRGQAGLRDPLRLIELGDREGQRGWISQVSLLHGKHFADSLLGFQLNSDQCMKKMLLETEEGSPGRKEGSHRTENSPTAQIRTVIIYAMSGRLHKRHLPYQWSKTSPS